MFASGTIVNSEQGSGIIEITNPLFGTNGAKIRLDMSAPLNPRRTSESSEFESAGVPNDVWVDFHYTGSGATQNGDFGDPFKTLAAAQDSDCAPALESSCHHVSINIVPGSHDERLILKRPMTIRSFPQGTTIGRQ
jgi:hypothetical protein